MFGVIGGGGVGADSSGEGCTAVGWRATKVAAWAVVEVDICC